MPVSHQAPAPRVLWKGAISFGLVHIPVALYSATTDHGIDFDWLDKRTMDPVGYKRINKKTGKEIAREQIVKGIEYEDGQYVVLSDAEIAAAYPKTTQTIEIETFVPADSIPFVYLERPYYVAPINRGAKVYALLRETLQRSGRVGVARVVIQTKQHLAVLVPAGPGAGAEPAALGRRHPALEATCRCRPKSVKAAGLTDARAQDGQAAGRGHELRLGPGRIQGLVQGRDHEAGRPQGRGRRDRDGDQARADGRRPAKAAAPRSSTSPSCCSAACARAAPRPKPAA